MEMKISIGSFKILYSLAQASFIILSGNEEEINKPATAPNEPVTLRKSLSGWNVWELDLIDVYHWKQRY
eukprot:bmy_22067T0